MPTTAPLWPSSLRRMIVLSVIGAIIQSYERGAPTKIKGTSGDRNA